MSIERTVAALTPVFGALSAWVTGWAATHLPGLPAIPAAQVTALEITGFTAAAAAALKWLHGRQKYVTLTDDAKQELAAVEQRIRTFLQSNPQAGASVQELEQLLNAHAGQIEQALEAKVPAVLGQTLANLFAQINPPGTAAGQSGSSGR